jgi:hypothetical protein
MLRHGSGHLSFSPLFDLYRSAPRLFVSPFTASMNKEPGKMTFKEKLACYNVRWPHLFHRWEFAYFLLVLSNTIMRAFSFKPRVGGEADDELPLLRIQDDNPTTLTFDVARHVKAQHCDMTDNEYTPLLACANNWKPHSRAAGFHVPSVSGRAIAQKWASRASSNIHHIKERVTGKPITR